MQGHLRRTESDLVLHGAEVLLEDSSQPLIGKNAEERAAKLAVALKVDPVYQRIKEAVERLQRSIASQQDVVTHLRDLISGHKRTMDFIIAWTRFLAREGGENDDE